MPDQNNGAQPVTVAQLHESINRAIDRALDIVAQEFAQLRQEISRHFELVERRFEAVDRRLDRLSEASVAIQQNTASLSRWADRLDRDNNELHSTQAAQQKAIDDIAARLSKVEAKLTGGPAH